MSDDLTGRYPVLGSVGQISREAMFQPLLAAEPDFRPLWEAFLAEWAGEKEPPLYLALSDLSRFLVARLEAEHTNRFVAVFGVVERWLTEGDQYVREAAASGLIETLQNTGLYATGRPEAFLAWLGPEALRSWREIEAFWAEGKPLSS